MKNKKIAKQLMAIGVQRNDAAAFARAYRKIIAAGRRDLFPEMEFPVPNVVQTAPVRTLGVTILRHRYDLASRAACGVDLDQYIREAVAKELAQHLVLSPYVQYQQRDLNTGVVEFKALVRVVEAPYEGGVYERS